MATARRSRTPDDAPEPASTGSAPTQPVADPPVDDASDPDPAATAPRASRRPDGAKRVASQRRAKAVAAGGWWWPPLRRRASRALRRRRLRLRRLGRRRPPPWPDVGWPLAWRRRACARLAALWPRDRGPTRRRPADQRPAASARTPST